MVASQTGLLRAHSGNPHTLGLMWTSLIQNSFYNRALKVVFLEGNLCTHRLVVSDTTIEKNVTFLSSNVHVAVVLGGWLPPPLPPHPPRHSAGCSNRVLRRKTLLAVSVRFLRHQPQPEKLRLWIIVQSCKFRCSVPDSGKVRLHLSSRVLLPVSSDFHFASTTFSENFARVSNDLNRVCPNKVSSLLSGHLLRPSQKTWSSKVEFTFANRRPMLNRRNDFVA